MSEGALIAIVGGMFTFFGAVLTFLQYSFNKRADLKAEKEKKEIESRFKEIEEKQINDAIEHRKEKERIKQASARVYGALGFLIHNLDADRAYIIQPHPDGSPEYISVSHESLGQNKGIKPFLDEFHKKLMSEYAIMSGKLSTEKIIVYKSGMSLNCPRWQKEMRDRGNTLCVYMQLENFDKIWIGNLVVEYTTSNPQPIDYIKKIMEEQKIFIEYDLPVYNPVN